MKFRIIERGDGKFLVEEQHRVRGVFKDQISWMHVITCTDDYPREEYDKEDHFNALFSTLELAEKKIKSLIEYEKLKTIKDTRKVIKEVEV